MCFGSTPAPPDPYATGMMQNQINADAIKTAAQYNQINQNNPFGSLTYTGELGTPDRTQNVTLNPQLQTLLNSEMGNANLLAGMGTNLINAQGNITPFNPGENPVQYARQEDVTPLQTSIAAPTQQTVGNVQAGPLQSQLNTAGVQQIEGPDAFAPQIQQTQQAAYNAQTGLLQPGFQQAQQHLQAQLAAQGIDQNSPAYATAMGNLQRSQNEALTQAANQAVGAGNAQQQALFGENLQGSQAQFQQALQSGQFGQQAQQLAFGEGLSNAQLANSLNNQQFGQNLAQAQFNNQALQNSLNEHLQVNNANQSLYQQNFGNQQATQTQNLNALMALINSQQIQPNAPQFNPYATTYASQASPNAIGLAGSNYGYQSQAGASGLGSIFGALGSIGGGLAGNPSLFSCWVAREAFDNDPKWLKMQRWMLLDAPKALRRIYMKAGQRIAEYISNKPELKALIREQMEAVLG